MKAASASTKYQSKAAKRTTGSFIFSAPQMTAFGAKQTLQPRLEQGTGPDLVFEDAL